MGLFEKIFGPRPQAVTGAYFKTLTGYSPVFVDRAGGIYEMELTRSAIHATATAFSKLKPEAEGDAAQRFKDILQSQPNPFQNTVKFLYSIATIVEVDTCCFLVPMVDSLGNPTGHTYPIRPSRTSLIEDQRGQVWVKYSFAEGRTAYVEWERVGILTKYEKGDTIFGGGNAVLQPTLDLLDVQRQGMSEGIKNAAVIRFIGRLAGTLRPDTIKEERERFSAENLSADNTSGVMLVDAKYADIQQIESKPFVIDAEQMKLIKDNVFAYFGTNEAILQNSFDEEAWNAFYEGKIEPLALDLALVLTNMYFTPAERSKGNAISFSAHRLQYASNKTKLDFTTNMIDRGLITDHAACEVWNMPKPDTPPRRIIRGEYIDVALLPSHTVGDAKGYLQMPPGDAAAGEDVKAPLDSGQVAALVQVIQALKDETLTPGQAANIVAVALAISVEDARDIVEGKV